MLVVNTIRPCLKRRIPGNSACVTRKAEVLLLSMTRRHSSSVVDSHFWLLNTPAIRYA